LGVPARRRRAMRFNLFGRPKKDFRFYPSRNSRFYKERAPNDFDRYVTMKAFPSNIETGKSKMIINPK
jgi:hypothetical protein